MRASPRAVRQNTKSFCRDPVAGNSARLPPRSRCCEINQKFGFTTLPVFPVSDADCRILRKPVWTTRGGGTSLLFSFICFDLSGPVSWCSGFDSWYTRTRLFRCLVHNTTATWDLAIGQTQRVFHTAVICDVKYYFGRGRQGTIEISGTCRGKRKRRRKSILSLHHVALAAGAAQRRDAGSSDFCLRRAHYFEQHKKNRADII